MVHGPACQSEAVEAAEEGVAIPWSEVQMEEEGVEHMFPMEEHVSVLMGAIGSAPGRLVLLDSPIGTGLAAVTA